MKGIPFVAVCRRICFGVLLTIRVCVCRFPPYPRIYISLGVGCCEAWGRDEGDACVLIGAYAMSVGGFLTRNEADFHALYPTLTMFHPATARV